MNIIGTVNEPSLSNNATLEFIDFSTVQDEWVSSSKLFFLETMTTDGVRCR